MSESSQHVRIRQATLTDAGSLAHYRLAMFREIEYEPQHGDGVAFANLCRQTFHDLLSSGTCIAWFAEVPGEPEPAGTLVMLTIPRLPTLNNLRTVEGYIINVYVVPAWRRRGIATSLMQTAIDYSRLKNYARIRLRATEAGQGVYERVGFRGKDNVMELKLNDGAVVS